MGIEHEFIFSCHTWVNEKHRNLLKVSFKPLEFFYLLMLGCSIKLMSISVGVPFVSIASWADRNHVKLQDFYDL